MMKQGSKPAEDFAETGTGAVMSLSVMFLSLPLLLLGLAWMGIAKLFSGSRPVSPH